MPDVPFVCVHNAGRSQMAAAFLQHHVKGRVRVRSAGSAPGSELDPALVAAMSEVVIDLSHASPRHPSCCSRSSSRRLTEAAAALHRQVGRSFTCP